MQLSLCISITVLGIAFSLLFSYRFISALFGDLSAEKRDNKKNKGVFELWQTKM